MGGDQGPGKARRSAEGRIVVTFDLDFGEIAGLAATARRLPKAPWSWSKIPASV
jgi:hypothetical protein